MTHGAFTGSPIVEVRNLSVEQHGTLSLRNFSAKLMANDKAVLSGPSGSGKSTLLKALMGFCHFNGDIKLFDHPLSSGNLSQCRSRIAYLGQHNALSSATVEEHVSEVCDFRINREQGMTKAHVRQCLDYLQLPRKILHQRASALSGGEQQRVRLALIMALERELYLLDEPTASMDDSLRQVVVDWLSYKPDATILVAAHDRAWEAVNWLTLPLHA